MTDPTSKLVADALAVARVRALRMALLALHKTLIDAERVSYERAHGRIESPHHALRLLMEDPWFAWLRPMAQLIVQIDERLAEKEPLTASEAAAFEEQIQRFVRADTTDPFGVSYQRVLQDAPAVVVAHGRVMSLLAGEGA